MAVISTARNTPLLGTDKVLVAGTITMDADPDNEPLSLASLGLSVLDYIGLSVDEADNGEDVGNGLVPQFDYALLQVTLYESGTAAARLDVAADGEVTDVVVRFLAFGTKA